MESRNHLHQTVKQQLELADHTVLMQKLDTYYRMVNKVILSRQHPFTGLFPASTAVNSHGDYRDAWVRDNVYTVYAVFALHLAYKRCDDDKGRTYELEHATIKMMRGLLFAMMKQCEKVELFKNKQLVTNSLHAKYSTSSGDTVVGDLEWGHLQLDATSIFLLALAQMTCAGLQIIFTQDEVDFIQNLVFYIERAYRTPDYGIWERGNKINHGQPELNSSSIGMAVAALQAINGCNLFGMRGGPSSVIIALPDEITRNYSTLHSMLPRESYSKEIDAALWSVIGFPAFAVHDPELMKRTRDEIIHKLGGNYGCKRFLRDGHQTALEDTTRLHYDPHELQVFENIECEWPLFFTYAVLDGLFSGDFAQVNEYRHLLEKTIVFAPPPEPTIASRSVTRNGKTGRRPVNSFKLDEETFPLLPELYFVPKDSVEAEKKHPHSQAREPNANIPLVWAQSLYIVGELMYEGLLSPAEIDPLGRYLLPSIRGNQKKDTVVQIVLLAEDSVLQSRLSTFGLEAQTLDQVAPITIASPSALRNVYTALGANEKLGLSGRPKRPIGTLGTSKLYRIQGRLFAFTPHFMDKEEFYMTTDNDYLVSVFEHELLFLRNHWWYTGRPTMVVYLTHNMLGSLVSGSKNLAYNELQASAPASLIAGKSYAMPSRQRKSLLSFIMSLRSGVCSGVRVRLGRLQEVVPTSCVESLDFVISKVEQGYFGNRLKSWQDLLTGLNEQKRWDSKLHLADNTSPIDQRFSVQRFNSVKSNASPILAPQIISHVPSPEPESLDGRYYTNTGTLKKRPSHNYKLKTNGLEHDQERPSSPLLIAKKSSVFDLPEVHAHNHHSSHALSHGVSNHEDNHNHSVHCLYITLGDPAYLETAQEYLGSSANIHDQVDLLHYIYSCKGLEHQIRLHETGESASVKELLEEAYLKASDSRIWSVVRQVAGILKKVVNSLTINLTDLLVRQKQVTIGFGGKEYPITAPLSPDVLADIIYSHCVGDSREAPLVQELLIYLGSYVRSEPHLFDGIIRVRVHYIILAMREEVARMTGCNDTVALENIMKMSPSEVKALLGFILSARDYTRQLDTKSHNSKCESPKVNSVEVKAQSAGYHDGNFCTIQIGDCTSVDVGERGMNVVAMDPDDGSILETTSFDTHISKEESDDFAKMIESYETGVIFIISAKDDAFENLTEAAKVACEEVGSKYIRQCQTRDSWCIIGRKNSPLFVALEAYKSARLGATDVISNRFNFGSIKNTQLDVSSSEFLPNKGVWLRRRNIDGALQRSPVGFYPKIHRILQNCTVGLKIHDTILPRDPTVGEKTPEELNFALQVEWLLNAVSDPAEREIAVECLVALSELERSRPELKFSGSHGPVDIISIIHETYKLFWNSWIVQEGYQTMQLTINAEYKTSKHDQDLNTVEDILLQYAYEKHQKLAQRMFIDLSQDGSDGTLYFLNKSIYHYFNL